MDINRYAYAGNDPINGSDPNGHDTEVSLQSYALGGAAGSLGFSHQYVLLHDTDTGKTVISRAGPSVSYPGGATDAAEDNDANGTDGKKVTLVTQLKPANLSIDSDPETGKPRGATVPGSQVRLKQPLKSVEAQLKKLNKQVDASGIPYKPRSTNSNAYAGTAYKSVTEKAPPSSFWIPGSGLDLKSLLKPETRMRSPDHHHHRHH